MTDNLFKYFSGARTKLRSGQEVFCSRVTGRTSIVPKSTVFAATSCKEFGTLKEHADRIKLLSRQIAEPATAWESILAQAVENGLLLSIEDIRNRLLMSLTCLPKPRVIDTIGIPTRNRPELLKRLLMSLAGNLRLFAREVDVLVVDDSESAQMQAANYNVISAFANDPCMRLRYGNRRTRNHFAAQLATESAVPRDLVSFALSGTRDYCTSPGAPRNSILIESAGHCVLYLDDDVQARIAVFPGSRNDVVFQCDSFETWFFDHCDDIQKCQFTVEDLLELHEQVLNVDRSVVRDGSIFGGPVDISAVSSRLLRWIENGDAAVLISVMGIVGDSGFDDPLAYFILGPETLSRLTEHEKLYRAALINRTILHGLPYIGVSDQCECHSYCMAVDNAELLPPFMPVMRGEELVFSALVRKCIPGGLFGVVPRAILHQPAETRQFVHNAALHRAGKFMLGETLGFLIGQETIKGSCRRGLIRSLGIQLAEVANLDDRELQKQIRLGVEPMLTSWIQRIDEAVDTCSKASDFWITDALKIKTAIVFALNQRDYSVPSDLEEAYGGMESRRRLRTLIRQFASLLQAWPDVVEASTVLKAKGANICFAGSESSQTGCLAGN
jgi:hypothetical protein